jgi:hypothetical protein
MKNLIPLISNFIVSIALTSIAYGQNTMTSENAKDSLKKNGLEIQPDSKTRADIVINMAMIESFRRCYDKIEVISWGDMFRSLAGDDAEITWMAYERMAFIPSADSISNTSLAMEKEKIRTAIENNQPLKKSIIASVPDDKITKKPKNINNTTLLSLNK